MKVMKLNATRQKSYYGKAKVIEHDGIVYLKSYDTIVCAIDHAKVLRFWGGYSATTMKHIDDFVNLYGLDSLGKKQWESLPVESPYKIPYEVDNVPMKFSVSYYDIQWTDTLRVKL